MTRLVVVLSESAVTPGDMLMGVQWCDSVLFVGEDGEYLSSVSAVLREAGDFLPITDDENELTRRIQAFQPDGIVTFSEHLLPITARLAERLRLPFHSTETVRRLRDKQLQRECLNAAGVDTMRISPLRAGSDWPAALSTVGLPMVLKPRTGQASRDTHLVTEEVTGQALAERLLGDGSRQAGEFLAEEYLVGRSHDPFGDYVSVESVVVGGVQTLIGVTGKLPLLSPFRETGQFHPAGLSQAEETEVVSLAKAAAEALGVRDGVVHTEIKLTADGPRVIEVNGRIGGYIHELYSRVWATDIVELVTRASCLAPFRLPHARQSGVHFQQYHQPPLESVRFLGVEGRRTALRRPGVIGHRLLVQAGSTLPQDFRSHDLDLLTGRAASHAEMLGLLATCGEDLIFSFESRDGVLRVTGDSLQEVDKAGA